MTIVGRRFVGAAEKHVRFDPRLASLASFFGRYQFIALSTRDMQWFDSVLFSRYSALIHESHSIIEPGSKTARSSINPLRA